MQKYNKNNDPISVQLDTKTGVFFPCPENVDRFLSDFPYMFQEIDSVQEIIKSGDRKIYEICYYPFLTDNSDMALGVTTILSGTVGKQYHMTKGHFHERNDQPEIYHCVNGVGFLQMMDSDGNYFSAPWEKGTITHIPPQFAHRVINTGEQPLIFVAVFHISAGHEYDFIKDKGFKFNYYEVDGKPKSVLNPNWR